MTKKTQMIALDLDGTLTNHNKEVTPLTRKALLDAEENGAVLVLGFRTSYVWHSACSNVFRNGKTRWIYPFV